MNVLTTIRNGASLMLIAGAWHTGFAQSATTKTHPPAKPPLDARWILDYPKEDNTSDNSDVRRDPKYLPFLKTYLTQKSFFSAGPRSLWQVASEFLGVGSGRVTIYAQRYATINGCVAHMCDELQGFLWVDTVAKPPRVYFAATKAIDSQGTVEIQKSFQLWIFANQALNDDDNGGLEPLPTEFLGPLSDWLGQLNVAAVMFVGHVGEEIPLLPGSLHTKQSTNDSAKGSI